MLRSNWCRSNYIAEEAGFPNLGDVDEYVPDFLFCAICTRLSGGSARGQPGRFVTGIPSRDRGNV